MDSLDGRSFCLGQEQCCLSSAQPTLQASPLVTGPGHMTFCTPDGDDVLAMTTWQPDPVHLVEPVGHAGNAAAQSYRQITAIHREGSSTGPGAPLLCKKLGGSFS